MCVVLSSLRHPQEWQYCVYQQLPLLMHWKRGVCVSSSGHDCSIVGVTALGGRAMVIKFSLSLSLSLSHTHTHTCTHTCTHIHTHTHTYVPTHPYTHTHTHTPMLPRYNIASFEAAVEFISSGEVTQVTISTVRSCYILLGNEVCYTWLPWIYLHHCALSQVFF